VSVSFSVYDGAANRLVGERDLNFSNANASLLLAGLGFDVSDLWGELEPASILAAVERLKTALKQGRGSEFTRSYAEDHAPGKAHFFSMGLGEDGLLDRAKRLAELAAEARDAGFTISYG
jgi:hypothetical protein